MKGNGGSAEGGGGGGGGGSDVEAGFAKLQGEDFEYYMQTYSIILGRKSKKSTVDVDLASLGGGMNISRHHARIFYDFSRRRFALDVLGKNGCLVEGVLHLPGNPPVKLDSQDLLQIGDKQFYFLLPVRSILGGSLGPPPRHHLPTQYATDRILVGPPSVSGRKSGGGRDGASAIPAPAPLPPPPHPPSYDEEFDEEEEDDEEEEEEDDIGGSSGVGSVKKRRDGSSGSAAAATGSASKGGLAG